MAFLQAPKPIIAVLSLFGLAFFLRLGFWQLDRAEQKEQLFASFAHSQSLAPEPLSMALQQLQQGALFAPVAVSGRFVPNKTILLDNQSLNGVYGVQVYQLLQSDQGQALPVALGFLPAARDRKQFPTPSVAAEPVQLKGLLARPPSAGLLLAADPANTRPDIDLVSRFDVTRAQQFFAAPKLLPYVLLLDAKDSGLISSETYQRHWMPQTFPPEKHRGYALTWFCLAFAVVIFFIIFHRRRD